MPELACPVCHLSLTGVAKTYAVMGVYDFSRFTYLGHRRLFRQFDDVQSGMCGGPGCAAVQLTRNLLGACNAACACDVLGRKHSTTNPDREILAMFKGR